MENNYQVIPAIAIRGLVPIPHNDLRIEIGRENSVYGVNLSESDFESYIALLVQADPNKDLVGQKDMLAVGVFAKIIMRSKLPNGNFRVKFKIIERISIKNYIQEAPCFMIQYEPLETVHEDLNQESSLVNKIIEKFKTVNFKYFSNSDDIRTYLRTNITNYDEFADKISFSFNSKEIDRNKYLIEPNLNKRLLYLLSDLEFTSQMAEIDQKIDLDVQKSIDETQKEYYLREKMKAIQTELGDKAKKEEDLDKLKEKILAAKMPKEIEQNVLEDLKRYRDTPPQMPDSQVLRNYLDFVVALPWYQVTEDNDNLKDVMQKLDANHYGLDKVKERIVEYLAVKIMTKKNPTTILCLVGPPGVGKTSLAISIANALGRKFIKQSFGGVRDEAEIRGHRRTYIGALPGRILKSMKDAGVVNPVFLIDEIDKMASDYRGDPASAMLEVLDPEQNKAFSDHYLEEPYDLSQVLFIATANYIENIPAPLRDRMEIIEVPSYTKFEKFQIARQYLIPLNLTNHGISDKEFQITDEAIFHIIEHFTMEAGVRELNRTIGSLIRKVIKEILTTDKKSITITKENINSYLGKDRFIDSKTHHKDRVGVVNGLAYTEYGGDTIDIEATYYQGHGGLILTGKLGDVMKESAQTALSYVKAHADEYQIDTKLLEEKDIHIHVPEGAVPKDGPSAGVTFATAIVSALTGKKVKKDIGMTGEITLRGTVLPIGGLREKSIAANRKGLKEILIPFENQRDIEDIPEEVKNSLVIKPVKNVEEVLKEAIIFE